MSRFNIEDYFVDSCGNTAEAHDAAVYVVYLIEDETMTKPRMQFSVVCDKRIGHVSLCVENIPEPNQTPNIVDFDASKFCVLTDDGTADDISAVAEAFEHISKQLRQLCK